MALWYDEVHKGVMRFGLRIERTLFSEQSPYQKVSVVQTSALGRALLIDDLWMVAEGDEKTYHEMIVHPALTTCPRIARVLVIGGGDGGTVREILRHPEVEHVDLVEIDEVVIRASREHLAAIGTAWEDPRLHIKVEDGIAFVKNAPKASYDVVIIDGSDPVGPAQGLFNHSFFQDCARILSPRGVCVTQAESPTVHRDVHLEMIWALGETFERVHPYYGTVAIYPGGAWSWIYASHGCDPMEIVHERAARVEPLTHIYNREVHRAAFAVPNHLRRELESR